MITPEDRDTLRQILGEGPLPDGVEQEIELRTYLYHKGNTGRLGALAVIDALRHLGIGSLPAVNNEALTTLDFNRMAINARIWVKCEDGIVRRAQYAGTNPGSRIAIRYDGQSEVKSVEAYRCFLHEPVMPAKPVVVDSPLTDDEKLNELIQQEQLVGAK